MTINTISTLPTAPARTDAPATFISRADAFLAALVVMQGELNTSIGQMNTDIAQVNIDATAAAADAVSAAASAAAAQAASNATEWVSGTSYSAGDVVYSPINYLSYRAIQATSGTTDPSLDTANWTGLNAGGGSGEQTFTATGAISTGDIVALNSDGTVSVIAETAGPPELGSPTQASGTGAINGEVTACYDPDQDAIFVAYRSQDNSGYLYGVVGTVSGVTITWGTPAVIYTQSINYLDSVYCPDDNRVVVVFNQSTSNLRIVAVSIDGAARTFSTPGVNQIQAGSYAWPRITYDPDTAKVIVCAYSNTNTRLDYGFGSFSSGFFTVSGTGVVYSSGGSPIRTPDITYDESQDKVLVVMSQENRHGAAIVGTVGASSITWGTAVKFEDTAVVDDGELFVRYDPTSQKSIVAYRLSSAGYANTITISGTTPSFGTKTNTGNRTGQALNYDSGAGKVVEMYKKSGAPDNDYLYFDTYSVSGTTVVVDSSTALTTAAYAGSSSPRHQEIVYDTDGILVAVYDDDTNSTVSGIAYDIETTTTNAADFIGISKDDISNAATGTILVNTGISEDQTGLTAQTGYYVTSTGGLSATATGYPFVGYATSATNILIGGKNLPSETGQSGKFLTTNGTNLSWSETIGAAKLLNTYSVESAVASIIVDDFTSDYDDYIILIDKLSSANNDQDFNVQMELDGSYQTANYSYAGIRIDNSLTYYNNTNTSYITLGKRTPDSPTDNGMTYPSYIVELSSVNDPAVHQGLKVTGQHLYFGTSYKFEGVGSYRNTTSILTGLKFFVALGNIVTANIKIYGITKAL